MTEKKIEQKKGVIGTVVNYITGSILLIIAIIVLVLGIPHLFFGTIVGDILDEYDNEEDLIEKVDENTYIVKSEISLEEINEHFDTELPEEDFDSLGGYIFNTLGRLANQGDKINFEHITMTVKKIHKNRIKLIEIKINV